jgi:hypothetical protein
MLYFLSAHNAGMVAVARDTLFTAKPVVILRIIGQRPGVVQLSFMNPGDCVTAMYSIDM